MAADLLASPGYSARVVGWNAWDPGRVYMLSALMPLGALEAGVHPLRAVHRTILVVDVVGFSDRRRTNPGQVKVRDGLYRALRRAFDQAGIPWAACDHEDRGDGVFILAPPEVPKSTFVESAPGALVAALREHNSTHGVDERIRLRMALHAGEVNYDDHGATSAAIILTFRLVDTQPLKDALTCSSGVLALIVSTWFFDEVVRHSTTCDYATFRPVQVMVKETETIGWISLPDHPYPPREPESLVGRWRGEDGPTSTVALRTLPRDVAAFTGRRSELDQLLAAAEPARVVAIHTVDGMPGVGKSALVIHAAHLLSPQFPDGALFVRLHAHTPGQQPADPSDVLSMLLSSLGIEAGNIPQGLEAQVALWRARLTGRRMILVLDDAADHAQVEPLLPGAEGCLVFITSRRRLTALDGATPLALDTLPAEDAELLFTTLSRRDPTPAEADAVTKIVELCGHLPLAIALLAGRFAHHPQWNVAEFAQSFAATQDLLGELAAGDRAITAAFNLSYRDLPPETQRLFRLLGLHPGSDTDVYATAALVGIPPNQARRELEALYNDHLITSPAAGRYRLHDLIRTYSHTLAVEHDTAEDRAQCLERLLDYYQHTASTAGRALADIPGPPVPAARLTLDSAPEFTTHQQAHAWLRGERANLIACIRHAKSAGDHARLVRLTGALAGFLRQQGPWDEGIALHLDAIVAARRTGDVLGVAGAVWEMARLRYLSGDYTVITLVRQSLELYRSIGNRAGEAGTLGDMGRAQYVTGDYRAAADMVQQSLDLYCKIGNRHGEANALWDLGRVRAATRDLTGAVQLLRQSLELFRELDDPLGEASTLRELGRASTETGDLAAAAEELQQSLELFQALGNPLGVASTLRDLGRVREMAADYRAAVELTERALRLFRTLGNRHGEANGLRDLGRVWIQAGDAAAASEVLHRALDIYRELGNRGGEAKALRHLDRIRDANESRT